MRKIYFYALPLLVLFAGCQAGKGVESRNSGGQSSQVESTSSADLVGPQKDYSSNTFNWSASIPNTWEGYPETDDDGASFVILANYDPTELKKRPDDYHEIKVERLSAGEEESIATITGDLLAEKTVDARKLLFTKEYQGTRIEFSDAKGAKGLMTIFRQGDQAWVLTYTEPGELDGQIKWVYQRMIETFRITQ